MTIKPIVFVIGVEGHFYLAKALRDEFKRPVVGIITMQRMQEILTPERRAIFDQIWSLPDFYLEQIAGIGALDRAALDREQIALEQELGVNNGALFAFNDRTLRALGNDAKLRQWEICNLRFAKKFLHEVDPAFLMCGVANYIQLALRAACRKRGTPCLLSQISRAKKGCVSFFAEDGQQIGMQRLFNALQKGDADALPAETLAEADKAFDAFVTAPARPAYAVKNALTGFNFVRMLDKARWALRAEHLFPSDRIKLIDRGHNTEHDAVRIAFNGLLSRTRRMAQKFLGVFDENPDLSVPYIYLPLHYSPETSDLYFGTLYDHHEGFVTQTAKFIPSHVKLYVKEHTSMLGRRPTSFYTNLNRLPNVQMIDPRVDTFTLCSSAMATLTVTGTAGWEAFLLGKPAVALGDVFYNFLPGVLHCALDREFPARLDSYLQQFRPSESARRNAFRASFGASFKGEKVDFDGLSKHETATAAAQDFARGTRELIARFGNDIEGSFPQDLLSPAQAAKTRAA